MTRFSFSNLLHVRANKNILKRSNYCLNRSSNTTLNLVKVLKRISNWAVDEQKVQRVIH